ncbi:MAG: hypothetical protein ACYC41_00625 [Bacillota bacterium]
MGRTGSNHAFAIGEKWQLINSMDEWQTISQAFALLIGAINLTRIHVNNVRRREAGYIFSLVIGKTKPLPQPEGAFPFGPG